MPLPLCKKDRKDLATGHLTSCHKEHQESNYKVVGCFASDCSHAVFPKKLQLNLLRRGTALYGDASRGRRDFVDSTCSNEEESNGEDSDQSEDSEADGSEEESIPVTPKDRIDNISSSSRTKTNVHQKKKVKSASSSKKRKNDSASAVETKEEAIPAQRNLQKS
jgi:hypothetical protein